VKEVGVWLLLRLEFDFSLGGDESMIVRMTTATVPRRSFKGAI
jgi:hypothetical protein